MEKKRKIQEFVSHVSKIMAAYPLLSFLILFPCLIQLTKANPRKEIVVQKCQAVDAHNATQFLQNYKETAEMVKNQMGQDLYGYGTIGEPPDRVYLTAQCHPDLSYEDCMTCFDAANQMLSGCSPRKGGRIYLDGCYMRADNYSFYNDPPIYSEKFCSTSSDEDVKEEDQFHTVLRQVLSFIADRIPEYGFGYKFMEVSAKTYIWGMAICWKPTDNMACRSCVDNASKSILECLPQTEARVTADNCFLRYSDYGFFHGPSESPQREYLKFTAYAIIISFGCVVAIAIGILAGGMVHSRVNEGPGIGMGSAATFKNGSLNFKYSTLERATKFFNEMNKLGEGASSEVFKGCLADGREIAVKRLFISYKSQSDEIYNEMNILTRAQHKNLVRFLGCCLSNDVTLLVYEFLPNRSLDNFLFDPEKRRGLDWKIRFGIILGIAEGLQYLHNDCEQLIVHRDIKASNILLDLRFRPKIADFGLARFCSGETTMSHPPVCGTLGYMAPEYMAHGQLSEKLDVYSFGVLVLEIVSGTRNSKFKQDESLDTLVTTAWKHFQSNTVDEIIDEYVKIDDVEHVMRVIQVGLLCTQQSPSLRPTMTEAIEMLIQNDLDLPIPSKPPFIANAMEFSYSSASCKNSSESVSILCKPHYSDCNT